MKSFKVIITPRLIDSGLLRVRLEHLGVVLEEDDSLYGPEKAPFNFKFPGEVEREVRKALRDAAWTRATQKGQDVFVEIGTTVVVPDSSTHEMISISTPIVTSTPEENLKREFSLNFEKWKAGQAELDNKFWPNRDKVLTALILCRRLGPRAREIEKIVGLTITKFEKPVSVKIKRCSVCRFLHGLDGCPGPLRRTDEAVNELMLCTTWNEFIAKIKDEAMQTYNYYATHIADYNTKYKRMKYFVK